MRLSFSLPPIQGSGQETPNILEHLINKEKIRAERQEDQKVEHEQERKARQSAY